MPREIINVPGDWPSVPDERGIGPISTSESALKLTYANVGGGAQNRANKIFDCGGLSSAPGQFVFRIGPV